MWTQLSFLYFYCHKASSVSKLNSILNLYIDAWCASTLFCRRSLLVFNPTPQPLPTAILHNRRIKIEIYAFLFIF